MIHAITAPEALSAHLKALRKARHLSQTQLAALLGVAQPRVAEIEKNPGVVSVEQLLRVLAALGSTLLVSELCPKAPQTAQSVAPATD